MLHDSDGHEQPFSGFEQDLNRSSKKCILYFQEEVQVTRAGITAGWSELVGIRQTTQARRSSPSKRLPGYVRRGYDCTRSFVLDLRSRQPMYTMNAADRTLTLRLPLRLACERLRLCHLRPSSSEAVSGSEERSRVIGSLGFSSACGGGKAAFDRVRGSTKAPMIAMARVKKVRAARIAKVTGNRVIRPLYQVRKPAQNTTDDRLTGYPRVPGFLATRQKPR